MVAVELLSTHGLTRQYGGLVAVDDVNFKLYQDRLHAIIGPNGAGKTTLVSLICGRTTPSSGRINFKGNDITGLSSAKRVQAGIVYTFQVTSIFSNLSCYENVALSVQRNLRAQQKGTSLLERWSMVSEADIEKAVLKYLLEVGLEGVDNQIAI